MINEDSHIDNVYAFDENFKELYIGDVAYLDRGIKKNYFCLGCKRQMQAVKPQTKRKQHFRHHTDRTLIKNNCSYRDETHRHLLAKENAKDLKRIKVPAVYKYSSNENEHQAFLINEAEFIEAHTVLNEHYIYENEYGEIKISETFKESEEKYLFIKPDTIFLDEDGNPILIIEFVATHKPDQSKLMKLKRLGIDAIQVNVPKSSPEEIRELFFKTNRTKWLYNHAENQTNYVQISNSYSGGIFEIDIEQRRLFEEGFECRKAQLGEFIRTISRILESEHYRETERNLGSEIQRVEGNSEKEEAELDDLRRSHSESGIEQHYSRRREFEKSQSEFRKYRIELEERYTRRKREIELERERIERAISTIEDRDRGNKHTRSEIERLIREEESSISNLEYTIQFSGQNEEREISEIEKSIERERREIEAIPLGFRENEGRFKSDFSTEKELLDRDIESIIRDIDEEPNAFRRNQEKLSKEFEEDSKRLHQQIENGDIKGDGWYSKELSLMDNFRRELVLYQTTLALLQRVEQKEREYNEKM